MAREKNEDLVEPLTWRDRAHNRFQATSFYIYSFVVIVLLLIGVLWPRMFIVIESGHHGVMYRTLGRGTITDEQWGEGLHVIPPWDELTVYETRLQQEFVEFGILSGEGLDLIVTASVRFRPDSEMLGYLHQDIGPAYYQRLIGPSIEAHVRETFGRRPAHDIYASVGDLVQEVERVPMLTRIQDGPAANGVGRPYIIIQEIKITDIDLPEVVVESIADRYRQQQLMLEYDDRIARAEKEAERKRIEAKGIHDYSQVAGDLSSDVLRWKDIEATLELAKSPNSKVIMLGGSNEKTPLVFSIGADQEPSEQAPSTPSESAPSETAPD
jgi:regulator of protease activity HflC (stomatin/prohibitin superfamily)